MNMIQLMSQAKKIAQYNAPYDTGNLRYNAIHAYPIHDQSGFKIIVRFGAAFYGTLLDTYGGGPKKLHKGWWSDKTFTDIGAFMKSVQNNEDRSYQHMNEQIAKFSPDNAARAKRFNQSRISE